MSPREDLAVPRAEFRSYYGRPILKHPAWDWKIAAYLFAGGLSAGSAMLAAGADVTGRPGLRRVSRLGALVSLVASVYFLVADLGRPERFHHLLRVGQPGSPMTVGTWRLTACGPGRGSGRGGGADAGSAAAELAGAAGELAGKARRNVGRRNGAGGGVLYGSSVVAHRGSGVARGAPVPAVRVHRLGCGERRRLGNGLCADARVGPGAADGGRGGGAGGGGVAPDGATAGALGGGVHDGQGAQAAEVVGVS